MSIIHHLQHMNLFAIRSFFRNTLLQYCLLLALLLPTAIHAQRFNLGISAGPVISDIDGADTRDTDNDFSKLSFTFGGLVNTQLAKRTVMQMELNFIQKGSLQRPDSNNNGYYNISLGYIEVPLLVKQRLVIKTAKKNIDKIDLEGGLSIGRMIYHKVLGSTNYPAATQNSLFNYNDVSLLAGADYNFSDNFYFCFRYSNSLIPAIRRNALSASNITYTFNRGNNMVYQFSFKYIIRPGKAKETN